MGTTIFSRFSPRRVTEQHTKEINTTIQNSDQELINDIEKINGLMKIALPLANKAEDVFKYKGVILACQKQPKYRIAERGVYQREAKRYQKMLDKDFNPIHESLENISKKLKNSPHIKEFEKVISRLHREHDISQSKAQINTKLKLALNCLANAQNDIYAQLEKLRDPSTGLKSFESEPRKEHDQSSREGSSLESSKQRKIATRKLKIQPPEPTVEKNLYTILGFEGVEDFENKINDLHKQQQLRDKLWKEFEKHVSKDKKDNKIAKNISNIIKESNDIEGKLDNLLTLKKQAESFLEEQQKETNVSATPDPSVIFHEISPELLAKRNVKKRKSYEKVLTSNTQDFKDTLQYIESLEKDKGITLEELGEYQEHPVKVFLLNYIKSLNKKYPNSQDKRIDAIKILSDSKLRKGYNWHVEAKIIDPMVSYRGYTDLDSRLDNAKNELKEIVEKKELEKGLETIDKLIVNAVHDIKKHREAIINCKDLQNAYIKEKEEHPLRGTACQKMIDIYQTSIEGYQEKIYQSLIPISELFKSMPQKMRDLPDVKEFQEIMDGMHKEHNTQQADEKIDSALICLANTRNKLNIQLEKMKNPSTDLRVSHINAKTEVTRL